MDDTASPPSQATLRAQLEEIGSRIEHLDADDTTAIDEILADITAVRTQLEQLVDHTPDQRTPAPGTTAVETLPEHAEAAGAGAYQTTELSLSATEKSRKEASHGINLMELDVDGTIDAIRSDLERLLTTNYLSIVQQLIGSPTASLSVPELVARNPDIPESTLRSRLTQLNNRERPLVIKLEPDVERVPLGYPQKYYAASARTVQLLQQIGLYGGCYRLMKLYEAAPLELPDAAERSVSLADIESYEHRPVPAWATA